MLRSTLTSILGVCIATLASAQSPTPVDPDLIGPPLLVPHGVVSQRLAGRPLAGYPHFEHTRAFHETTSVWFAVDLTSATTLTEGAYTVYVTEHRTPAEWGADPVLVDTRGAPQVVVLSAATIADNVVELDTGTLSGDAGTVFGRGYDVVIDVDGDGSLAGGDVVDGFGSEAGFYVMSDPLENGPLAVTEALYILPGPNPAFRGENTFYPTDIATMGELPLVVVSHGNGHDFEWYDHIGVHLASWGFVVMSHENNTGPGIETASTTTLQHTDQFLANLATIEGGILAGHIDVRRIIWMGHSRGGEGIVRAYDRLVDGDFVPVNYTVQDIIGLSSIAPTTFLDADEASPHGVDYSLWTGASDSDVNGCPSSPVTRTFLLHERATGDRFAIYYHGAGHGVFHNGNASNFATGPCQISRTLTHELMRGYLLPLVKHWAEGNVAATDFLWRQHEAFQPPNQTQDACIAVSMTYQRRGVANFVLDDFETNPATTISSSGGGVSFSVTELTEGTFQDPDNNFTHLPVEAMNGMTHASSDTPESGVVFVWRAPRFIEWEVVRGKRDLTRWRWLSLRAAQVTRSTETDAFDGDSVFTVSLRDVLGNTSSIDIGLYGGGVEEPYQRTSCGQGAGWANFFETIRIPVDSFATDGALDLTRIEAVRLDFGPSFGDDLGRLALDDVEFVNG